MGVCSAVRGAPDGRDDTTAWMNESQDGWLMCYGIVDAAVVFTAPFSNISDWSMVGPLYSTPTGQWEWCD